MSDLEVLFARQLLPVAEALADWPQRGEAWTLANIDDIALYWPRRDSAQRSEMLESAKGAAIEIARQLIEEIAIDFATRRRLPPPPPTAGWPYLDCAPLSVWRGTD